MVDSSLENIALSTDGGLFRKCSVVIEKNIDKKACK